MPSLDFKRPDESMKEFRARVVKIQSAANKRLARLEKAGLTSSPAYRGIVDNQGFPRFSVKGKSHNEVISQFWKMKRFMDAESSTVKGYKNQLKQTAQAISYHSDSKGAELQAELADFFTISNVLADYFENIKQTAIALDYRRLWHAVNTSIKVSKAELSELKSDGKKLQGAISTMLQDIGIPSSAGDLSGAVDDIKREFMLRVDKGQIGVKYNF